MEAERKKKVPLEVRLLQGIVKRSPMGRDFFTSYPDAPRDAVTVRELFLTPMIEPKGKKQVDRNYRYGLTVEPPIAPETEDQPSSPDDRPDLIRIISEQVRCDTPLHPEISSLMEQVQALAGPFPVAADSAFPTPQGRVIPRGHLVILDNAEDPEDYEATSALLLQAALSANPKRPVYLLPTSDAALPLVTMAMRPQEANRLKLLP